MTLSYPAGLPHPLREGYAYTPADRILRTPLESGRARQRVLYTSVPTFINAAWLLETVGQCNLLEAWAEQVAGADWFSITLTHPTGTAPQDARFTESLRGPDRVGNKYWRYSARLEIRNRPQVAPGWAEILPDYILSSDILDIAINREWPEA